MSYNARAGGTHLGIIRSWIQCVAANGERVTWGSNEPLQIYRALTPKILEDLACEIAQRVVDELVTADSLQELWVDAGKPPVDLHAHTGLCELSVGRKQVGTYLSLGDMLKSLACLHLRKKP